MLKSWPFILFILSALVIASPADAKRFRNSYISFELPKNWDCHIKGVATVCADLDKANRTEAQIVFAAKEAGPEDSIPNYKAYLNKPQMIEGFSKGKQVRSKVKHTRTTKVGNKVWVDSLHQSGEQEAYFTRYVVTVHNGLVILITFTIHKKVYPYYSQTMLNTLKSLTIVYNKNIVASSKTTGPGAGSSQPLGSAIGAIGMDDGGEMEFHKKKKSKTDMAATLLGLIVIIGAITWYVLKKKKII